MSLKPTSEMRKLVWSFTIPILLLVAIIVGYYLVDGIVSANNNAKSTKKILVQQMYETYNRIGENFSTMNLGPDFVKMFNPEIIQGLLNGQLAPLYGALKNITTMTSPSAYMAVVQNDAVVDSVSTPGVKVDPNEVPKTPPGGKYQIKDSFGNMKGTLLQVVFPVDLSKFGLKGSFNLFYIYNLTKQVNAVDKYFSNQKRDTIIKLSIAGLIALILFGLLSTFWLRYLVNRYVRKPIDKLNTSAQQLAVGTFEGEVEVDPDSDFAALQGLLKSGQLILRKFDERMGDPS